MTYQEPSPVWDEIDNLEQQLEAFTSKHQGEDLYEASHTVQEEGGKLLYQIGRAYYDMGEDETAAEYFEVGLSFALDVSQPYVADMVESFGYALLNSDQGKKALMLEAVYEEFSQNPEYCTMLGKVYMENGREEEAKQEFARAVELEAKKEQ